MKKVIGVNMQTYRIINIKTINKGALKYTFDATFGPITIRGCRLIKNRFGSYFVGLPQRSYQKDGGTSYTAIVEMTPTGLKALTEKALYACGLGRSISKSQRF